MKTIFTSFLFMASFSLFAAVPVISYSGPNTFTVGTAITPLTPLNTGGAVSVYGTVSTFCAAGGQAHGMAFNADYSLMYTGLKSVHRVGKVTMSTATSATLAGSGTAGYNDATGIAAQFNASYGTAVHPLTGDIFVADQMNNRIRKITAAGVVSTYAGTGTASTVNGDISIATFNNPCGLIFDTDGTLYVLTYGSSAIRKIDAAGTTVSSIIQNIATNTYHFAFANGYFYVSDAAKHNIYKVALVDGTNTIIAGSSALGYVDATGTAAMFNSPRGIVVDATGNLYVADYSNNRIRKITPDGVVTTVAGSGTNATTNGVGVEAAFRVPAGLIMDNLGNLYVGDAGGNNIRKVVVNSYTISPALPAGLTFDTQTGVISGTPTAGSASTDYTITAVNTDGSSSAILNITVGSGTNITDSQLSKSLTAYVVGNKEILLNGTVSKNAIASLLDVRGKILLTNNLKEGKLNIIPTPNIKNGLYLLSVKDNTGSQIIKVIVR